VDVIEAVTAPFFGLQRAAIAPADGPIKPYPLRNHGVLRPKSLDFLNLDLGVGRRVSVSGDGYVKPFSEVRFGDHRQYFSRGQFHIHRRR
jgi:hypothetical protein